MMLKVYRTLEKIIPHTALNYAALILQIIVGLYASFPTSFSIAGKVELQFPWNLTRISILILLLILTFLALFVSGAGSSFYKNGYDNLLKENEKFKEDWKIDKQYYLNSLKERSIKIMRDLNLDDTECRVTIYQHDSTKSIFIPILRYSQNLELQAAGRKYYPDHIGLISKAWTNAEACQQISSSSDDEWIKQNIRRNGLDEKTAKSISMKSKGIIGLRLTVGNTDHVGVIIIESLKQRRTTSDKLEKLKGKKEVQEISTLLKVTNNRIFNPDI